MKEGIEKTCETCGDTYKTKVHNQKYCKKSCQPAYIAKPPVKSLGEKTCELEGCDNKFMLTSSQPNKKFCRREHALQHHHNLNPSQLKVTKILTCEWCRETFEKIGYEANLKHVKFCSSKCNKKSTESKRKTVTNLAPKVRLSRRGKTSVDESIRLGLPDYLFGDATFCSYCGESLINSPRSIDHCIPRSFFLDVGVKGSNARGLTTHSCFKCNSVLSDKVFDTFKGRRAYITDYYQRIIDRYFNEENTWTEEELDEHDYDYVLRKFIEQKIYNKYVLIDKVDWPLSSEYEEIIGAVEFDVKYTDAFNKSQLPFMERFFGVLKV